MGRAAGSIVSADLSNAAVAVRAFRSLISIGLFRQVLWLLVLQEVL